MNNYNAPEEKSIPSPYNFVPLSKKIVKPSWGPEVTHDIPFKDGLSGELSVTLESMSPFYIRNGGVWDDEDRRNTDSKMHEFFNAVTGKDGKDKFIIPGSSIKGVLRNVLEIVSFGKMSRVSDRRYSLRDLYNKSYTSRFTKGNKNKIVPLSQAGWLHQKSGTWFLTPCSYARVEQREIERVNPSFSSKSKYSAVDKYNKFRGSLDVRFTKTGIELHKHRKNRRDGPISIAYTKIESLGHGDKKGTLVFTGQPSKAKHMEFIFYDSVQAEVNVNFLKKDFKFIHSKHGTGEPNEEWKYWSKKLENGARVPVFYLTENKEKVSNDNPPESLGLAMMYRLPYALTIGDAVRNTCKSHFPRKEEANEPDLADLIFGYVYKQKSLKGRVQIGHFHETKESVNSRESIPQVTYSTIMGSPKPTYYPNYLVQKSENGKLSSENYKTYMDNDAKVRGWKRYPVRSIDEQLSLEEHHGNRAGNNDTTVFFKPLPKGSIFTGKIRFHNLKPEELGALLWVLKWGGNGNCHHQVGMAKPLGFGRVKFDLDMENSKIIYPKESPIQRRDVEQKFIDFMEETTGKWRNSTQLTQLLTMADNSKQDANIPLKYPELSVTSRKNDFSELKKSRMVLRSFSGLGANSRNEHKPQATTNSKGKGYTNIVNPSFKPQNESSSKENSFESLLRVVKRINDKELKKELIALNCISRDELNRLKKALQKRNNWYTRKMLKDRFNWPEALRKLESKIEEGDEH